MKCQIIFSGKLCLMKFSHQDLQFCHSVYFSGQVQIHEWKNLLQKLSHAKVYKTMNLAFHAYS